MGKVFSSPRLPKLAQGFGGGGARLLLLVRREVGPALARCGTPTYSWPGIPAACTAPPVLSCLEAIQEAGGASALKETYCK